MSPAPAQIHPSPYEDEHLTDERCHLLETWNRDADPAVSVARARVEPGITTRWHRLNGIVERYLILAGEGRVEVQGLAPTVVRPGAVIYIPAGRGQRIANIGTGDLLFLAICTPRFVPEAYEDIDREPRGIP